jgi:hypothetical protein
MPIGSSKLGVLGAGLVPGGSVTFNASGTWAVPPGVKKVSVTGVGGTGNPGVAGNAGTPGNPGTGGGGGGTGGSQFGSGSPFTNPSIGGMAHKTLKANYAIPVPVGQQLMLNITNSACYAFGGGDQNPPAPDSPPLPATGQAGASGTGGAAGNAGQPGNTGQSSSAIGNNFVGGAGGNAPPGGNAGNAGTGGNGGGGSPKVGPNNPGPGLGGAGGNGGGNGGQGGTINRISCPLNPVPAYTTTPQNRIFTGRGGGGAGSVTDGQQGGNVVRYACVPCLGNQVYRIGGTGNVIAPLVPPAQPNFPTYTSVIGNANITTATMGGGPLLTTGASVGMPSYSFFANNALLQSCVSPSRINCGQISPAPLRPDALRAGGGGAGGTTPTQGAFPGCDFIVSAGGGGGGGRGNAGNAGGPSPTISGQAATPATFNCVPVTPGTPTPITVGTPGGQVVISWNPQ